MVTELRKMGKDWWLEKSRYVTLFSQWQFHCNLALMLK